MIEPRRIFTRKLRLLIVVCILSGLVFSLLFWPTHIDGCYTFGDYSTAGHNFMYFAGGEVSLILENGPTQKLGRYSCRPGVGWVWVDLKTGREILVKPHLFWIRFEQMDSLPTPPKLPLEFRDINFRETGAILRHKGLLPQ
jgi:hypothetical protein